MSATFCLKRLIQNASEDMNVTQGCWLLLFLKCFCSSTLHDCARRGHENRRHRPVRQPRSSEARLTGGFFSAGKYLWHCTNVLNHHGVKNLGGRAKDPSQESNIDKKWALQLKMSLTPWGFDTGKKYRCEMAFANNRAKRAFLNFSFLFSLPMIVRLHFNGQEQFPLGIFILD